MKHWKDNKNFFEEEIGNNKNIIYLVIKKLNKENKVLMTHYLHKDLVEKNNEEN